MKKKYSLSRKWSWQRERAMDGGNSENRRVKELLDTHSLSMHIDLPLFSRFSRSFLMIKLIYWRVLSAAAGELAFERHERSASGYVIVWKGFDDLAYGRINFAHAFFTFRGTKKKAYFLLPPLSSLPRDAIKCPVYGGNFFAIAKSFIAFPTRGKSKQSSFAFRAFVRPSLENCKPRKNIYNSMYKISVAARIVASMRRQWRRWIFMPLFRATSLNIYCLSRNNDAKAKYISLLSYLAGYIITLLRRWNICSAANIYIGGSLTSGNLLSNLLSNFNVFLYYR